MELTELRLKIELRHADNPAVKALLTWLIENGYIKEVAIE